MERVEGGVVGVGEGVEVFLGGAQAAVAESFFDGLDVGRRFARYSMAELLMLEFDGAAKSPLPQL